MVAEVPPRRPRPLATMKDMGMGDMGAMAGDDASCPPEHAAMGHCTPAGGGAMAGMDHGSGGGAMEHRMRHFTVAPQRQSDPADPTIPPRPTARSGGPRPRAGGASTMEQTP